MKKLIALLVFIFAIRGATIADAQIVIRPDYKQVPNQGYPSHSVVIKNVGAQELEVIVRWPDMKTDFHFAVDAKKDAEVMLPSHVQLYVRAWGWVYNKGRKYRKELRFQWYYDETLGKTVFWFPHFK